MGQGPGGRGAGCGPRGSQKQQHVSGPQHLLHSRKAAQAQPSTTSCRRPLSAQVAEKHWDHLQEAIKEVQALASDEEWAALRVLVSASGNARKLNIEVCVWVGGWGRGA